MVTKLLIVDDEVSQTQLLQGFLQKKGFHVTVTHDPLEAINFVKEMEFDLILSDYRMPSMTGLDLINEVKNINPTIAIIMMSAYGSIETAVEIIKAGASDFLTKPIDLQELLLFIDKSIDKKMLQEENHQLRQILREKFSFENIIGNSIALEEVMSMVQRVAKSSATVILRGESGTGKELIATALHFASPRRDSTFIKVNCAALPESLLESELFGHVKGSFTGAIADRKGKFEDANKGTIFLDEIGELTLTTQSKLLRVLQEKEFERVGSNQSIKSDVRIITATNRNLEKAVESKQFREDLFYRLNVVPIHIPPLKARRDDITALINHFIDRYSKENEKSIKGITQEARGFLVKYDYPGNIRELENIIERAIVLARDDVITIKDLPLTVTSTQQEKDLESQPYMELMTLEEAEKRLIGIALEKNNGVQTRAAKDLGISERALRYKIKTKGGKEVSEN
ncbi:MAG: sigma-54-dependent Fis family transcriptional regulator [Proteobacteria bacterium]|nr:sigma-54-dependent Fis family transcriptional regulator [Pseudomonadota bacterium]